MLVFRGKHKHKPECNRGMRPADQRIKGGAQRPEGERLLFGKALFRKLFRSIKALGKMTVYRKDGIGAYDCLRDEKMVKGSSRQKAGHEVFQILYRKRNHGIFIIVIFWKKERQYSKIQYMGKRMLAVAAAGMVVFLSACGFSQKEPAIPEQEAVASEAAWTEAEEPVVSERVTENDEIISSAPEEAQRVGEIPAAGRYVYQTLSADVKTVYDEILRCVLNHDSKITVSTLDKDLLDLAYEAMNADYGGLFWLNGYVYTVYTVGGEVTQLEFAPKYTMDYEERVAMQQSIDASVEQMLAGISISDSDYDKAKYVFETLIRNVDYDLAAPENQNIVSVFVYRRTVCQGYACATQYLLQQLGIESFIVTGRANGENHAWNVLKLDGQYYYMDTTWGNSVYSGEGLSRDFVNYDYLNVTTEEIERTHEIYVPFYLPTCTATEDNYFVKEGLYFSEWEPDAVGELISTAWFSGPLTVSVKFADRAMTDMALDYFVTQQHIADFCPGLNSYSYLNDLTQNVLTISF